MIVETHLQIKTRKNFFISKRILKASVGKLRVLQIIRSVGKMLQKKLVQKGRNSRKSHLHFNIYIFLAVSAKKIMSNMHKFINLSTAHKILIHKHMCTLKRQILEHRKNSTPWLTNHLHKSHFRRKLPKLFCEGA